MQVNRLHPLFAIEPVDANPASKPDGMLAIRGQDHIGDDAHIRFSEAFWPLESPPVSRGPLLTAIEDPRLVAADSSTAGNVATH